MAALAAVAVVVVCVAARAVSGSPSRRAAMPGSAPPADVVIPAPSAAGSAAPVGPTTIVAGVPMGYRHDQAGAVSAALHFLVASEAVLAMDESAAVAAQRVMATSAAADSLAAQLRSQLAAFRDGFGPGPVGYRVAPVADRVTAADADDVAVDVWYVAVIEPPDRPAYEDWRTMRYQLVWERGDWREAAEHDDPGPRPTPLSPAAAVSPADWAAGLAGFRSVGASDG